MGERSTAAGTIAPGLGRDESRARRFIRRVISIGAMIGGAALALALAPVLIPVAFVLDLLLPKGTSVLGFFLVVTWYLLCEVAGGTFVGDSTDCYPTVVEPKKITLKEDFVSAYLGLNLTRFEVTDTLADLEMEV